MYNVEAIDLETHHENGHIVRRMSDNKSEIWVIMCFISDCIIQTERGMERAQPGDCFIKSPDFIEYHYSLPGVESGFVNDWMYVTSDCAHADAADLKLPLNSLIHTGHPMFMRSNMQRIIEEKTALRPFWERKISNLVEAVLINLAKAYHNEQNADTMAYEGVLLQLREHMQGNIERQWTVEEMARIVQLSASRFSVLYKRRFGHSPNEDLIGMRLEKAKLLLLSTTKGLREIAQLCGFQNEYYFSRVFKERERIPPGVYRHQL